MIGSLSAERMSEGTVFTAGEGGYRCFRIPALVRAANGDILAFAEGRIADCKDEGDIDIVLKRSSDTGKTWSGLSVVAAYGNHVAGNPGPVLNEATGELLLAYNTSLRSEGDINLGRGIREVWIKSSRDHGRTWGTAINITLSVSRPNEPSMNPAYAFSDDWRWYAVTPGHALQMKTGPWSGRILIPANHNRPMDGADSASDGMSHCFWSDDGGKTWALGGNAPLGTNEVTAVELANGDLLFNMRHSLGGGRRALARSSDGGRTLGGLTMPSDLIAPVCQGSIIRYTFAESRTRNRILVSGPADSLRRVNMTVRLSYDEGKTWPVSRLVHAGFSAYSDMAVLDGMDIGLLYEGGIDYGSLRFARFDLEWLSQGKDKLAPTTHTGFLPAPTRAAPAAAENGYFSADGRKTRNAFVLNLFQP